jgi:hypothetical protein
MFVLSSLRIKHNKININFEVSPAFFFINAVRLIVGKDALCFCFSFIVTIFFLFKVCLQEYYINFLTCITR